MTTAADTPEIEQLKAIIADLREEAAGLASEIVALRDQLAEMRCLTPYDQPHDVIEVLMALMPGWPARRWRELTRLIEQRAASTSSGVS